MRRILLIIAVLAVPIFIVLKTVNFSEFFAKLLVTELNKKIYGKLQYKDANISLHPKSINFYFNDLELYDKDQAILFKAEGIDIKWSLANLFDPNQKIKELNAKRILLDVSKTNNGDWNFQRLFKVPSEQKLKFSFDQINVPEFDLKIKDYATNKELIYDDVKVFFQTVKKGKLYAVDIEANVSGFLLADLATMSPAQLSQKYSNNIILAKGNLNLNSKNNVLLNKNNFSLIFVNLETISLQLLSSLIDFGEYTNNFKFLTKALANSHITFIANVNSEQQLKNNFDFNLLVNHFMDFNQVSGDFFGNINSDKITVSKLNLNFDETSFRIKGDIDKWQEKNPLINFNVNVISLNLEKLKAVINQTDVKIPGFIYDLINKLLETSYLEANINLSDSLNSPLYDLTLSPSKASQSPKKIQGTIKYTKPAILIKELELPLYASKLFLEGKYDTKTNLFDFKFDSKAADINSLKELVIALPVSEAIKTFFDDFQVQGNADLSLNIYSRQDFQSNKKKINIHGPVKIKNAAIKFIDHPAEFKNLNADLEINNEMLNISNMTGYSNYDYFELRAKLNYRDLSKVNLEFASNSLDITNFDDLSFFTELKQNHGIESVSGIVRDIYISYVKDQNKNDLNAHLNLDTVDLLLADNTKMSKIKGLIDVKNNVLKLTKITSTFGPNSVAIIDGFSNQDFTAANFLIQGKGMPISVISQLVNAPKKFKLEFTEGLVNINMLIKDKELSGFMDLNKVGFKYLHPKYGIYPLKNIDGKLIVNQDFILDNLQGQYGSSYFNKLDLKINKYRSKDKVFKLTMNGDVLSQELMVFVPNGIRVFLGAKGYMPLKMTVEGTKQKQNYNVITALTKLESFTFANWLVYQKNVPIDLKAKFMVTPHLITSQDCRIIFTKAEPDGKNSITRLNSKFQIEDWSSADKISYLTSFSTRNKFNNADLAYVEPQIISLKPLNLKVGKGGFDCETIGNSKSRQTICDIKIKKAIAQKYGIGDLNANQVDIGLLSINNKPLDLDIAFGSGDWNGIPYKDLDFDLKVNGDYVYIDNLKAVVKDGTIAADTTFNIITLESSFRIKGDKLPAHELVEGIWGFGEEVPEGLVSGVFVGQTVGVLPEPMFFNLEGKADLSVRNGRLSQLRSMQRILTFANTLTNFDINNVFQILVNYKGGIFNDLITSLNYDKGRISSEKLLLKAEQIELNLNGEMDFNKDQLVINGKGLIPKRAKSILQAVGIGEANLGNVLSMANFGKNNANRIFEFKMEGPITDMNKSVQSLRSNFLWVK